MLREKRDRVLTRLRSNCQYKFDTFNQGSYEMGTGVKPVSGDYDIDVGVVFPVEDLGRCDPLLLKHRVYDAVAGHTNTVYWKEPCITVQYRHRGEPVYHVDLAVYAKDRSGQLFLARGKQHSGASQRKLERADPQGLTAAIGRRWSGEDAAQFRRVIQYLKRWKDLQFPMQGNAAPVGIGLTVVGDRHFSPVKAGSSRSYDDFTATKLLVAAMARSFQWRWSGGASVQRLSAQIPVSPQSDVFASMTDQKMTEFKGRVDALRDCLDEAGRTLSAAPLRRAFGPDFPL
ncbi:MAG: nucleotidyltransferase [Myxococcota bacterium]|nr:nucleotidyltransferase [Myxococcota bacterium]